MILGMKQADVTTRVVILREKMIWEERAAYVTGVGVGMISPGLALRGDMEWNGWMCLCRDAVNYDHWCSGSRVASFSYIVCRLADRL